jgi:hypothetical protein
MFPWQSVPPRADHDEAIRRWADLEGTSATMRDDLYREHQPQPSHERKPISRLIPLSEIAFAVFEILDAWFRARSR